MTDLEFSGVFLEVKCIDAAEFNGDALFLKFAESYRGADAYVSQLLKHKNFLMPGQIEVLNKGKIKNALAVQNVVFRGVGSLIDFRYEKIRQFGYDMLSFGSENVRSLSPSHEPLNIATTVHGPGYGLDEREAFYSLLQGFKAALQNDSIRKGIRSISILERDERVASRLEMLLKNFMKLTKGQSSRETENFGKASEAKPTIFIAMPFSEKFDDEWHAITEAGEGAGFKMERLDIEPYVGDVLNEIKRRIENCSALVALLTEKNPNVFLELGYAWGRDKPTILVQKDGEKSPFDVQGQKQIRYKSSFKLRDALKAELQSLNSKGLL